MTKPIFPSPSAGSVLDEQKTWRCFHCGFNATTTEEARNHFGPDRSYYAACQGNGGNIAQRMRRHIKSILNGIDTGAVRLDTDQAETLERDLRWIRYAVDRFEADDTNPVADTEIDFLDREGNPRKIVYIVGDEETGIGSGWLLTAAPAPVLVIELDQPRIADGGQCNEHQPHAPSLAAQKFYGWYDDASQARDEPTIDPPHDAPCPFCGSAITDADVRTHSLMYRGQYAARSYFYRTHRTCAEKDASGTGMDGFILDMIQRNGD